MKKIIAYSLVVLALIIGASTSFMYQSNNTSSAIISQTSKAANVHSVANFKIDQTTFPFANAASNELNNLVFSHCSFEKDIPSNFLLRLNNARNLALQQFSASVFSSHLRLTDLQYNGFYIYFLCKMLI